MDLDNELEMEIGDENMPPFSPLMLTPPQGSPDPVLDEDGRHMKLKTTFQYYK